MKKVAFIINPKAGVKKKIDIPAFIQTHFPSTISYDSIVWENKDDFESIHQQIHASDYTIVVACGGDGTVNHVASSLKNTPIALGVLPLGSGNGLARSLGISMDLKQALKTVAEGKITSIDSGQVNGKSFFCTCGVGFDAYIANCFATSTTRGFWTYVKLSVKEYFKYKPYEYRVTLDDTPLFTQKAFLITVANAGQWGSNVYIAPEASMQDGLFHVSVLTPFANTRIPAVGLKLFTKKIHRSAFLKSYTSKSIQIKFPQALMAHVDGEPFLADSLDIKMHPNSLKVVCQAVL